MGKSANRKKIKRAFTTISSEFNQILDGMLKHQKEEISQEKFYVEIYKVVSGLLANHNIELSELAKTGLIELLFLVKANEHEKENGHIHGPNCSH